MKVFLGMMSLLLLSGGALAAGTTEDGGPVAWIKNPTFGLAKAKLENRVAMVFFTADWCPPCKELKATTLKDEKVGQATTRVVPIYVDLTNKEAHPELVKKYAVSGIPKIVYCDPAGEPLKEMSGRDVKAFLKDIAEVTAKFPGGGSVWQRSLQSALDKSAKDKKPVALVLVPEDTDLAKFDATLMKGVASRKSKVLWVLDVAEKGLLEKYKVEKGPAVVLLTPKTGDVIATVAVGADGKSEELNKALDEATKK